MPKVMLINVTHSEESRVGILNEGVLEAFEIESLGRAYLKGNIYKGVVHRIHPALEAAFVDIGGERDAFLPLDEICFNNLDERPKANGRGDGDGRRKLRIRDLLRPGQELLVQITKEQFANKPPTVSTFYSLPGRYLVLLPGSDDTGISRRIEGEERDRLKKLVEGLKPDSGFGLIVRTVAGLEENGNDLPRDLDYLRRLWTSVQSAAVDQPAPALVYREHDIVQRAIRDFYTPNISEIYIDDEEVYERTREFLTAFMPGSEAVLNLYRGEQPMFSAFKVEEQIDAVFERRVRLRSGGSIVIDGTEALTAIDVNSGGAVRGANPEETAFRTNREAAAEVARQMRLRDIGGIIVVDFIDMRDSKHIREIEQLVKAEMHIDKARHEVSRITDLGLMEISRQRLRPAAANTSHSTCPLCQGYGSVRASASAGLAGIRKIHNRMSLGDVESMRVALPSAVALYVLNQKREDLAHLEARYESVVEIRLSDTLLPHEIEIDVTERSRNASRKKAVEPGTVAEASPAGQSDETKGEQKTDEAAANGDHGPSGRKKRRRRRRRGGARSSTERNGAANPTDGDGVAPSSPGEHSEREPSTAGGADKSSRPPHADSDTSRRSAASDPSGSADAAATPTQSTGEAGNTRARRPRGRRGGRRRSGTRSARAEQGESGQPPTSPTAAQTSETDSQRGSGTPARTPQPTSVGPGHEAPEAARSSAAPASTTTAAVVPTPPVHDTVPPSNQTKPAPIATKPAAEQSAAGHAAGDAAGHAAGHATTRTTKKAAPKTAAAKKTTSKKVAAKKTARKTTSKKVTAKKKPATKKAATKKTTAKKATAKKTTAKKTTAKKLAAEKSAEPKARTKPVSSPAADGS